MAKTSLFNMNSENRENTIQAKEQEPDIVRQIKTEVEGRELRLEKLRDLTLNHTVRVKQEHVIGVSSANVDLIVKVSEVIDASDSHDDDIGIIKGIVVGHENDGILKILIQAKTEIYIVE